MKKYLVFFLISLSILLVHAHVTKHAIYGDGNGYFVTAWSLLYDHSFNSTRILDHLRSFEGSEYTFSRIFWDESKNPYSVGTSLFWIPSLFLISLFNADNFNLLHELGPGITGILLMLGGLYFIEQTLLRRHSKNVALITIITLYLGSNLFYYSSLEPALSHQPAFFLISFLIYWVEKMEDKKFNYLLLGLLFGLVHITRIADTFLLVPIFFARQLRLKNLFYILLGFTLAIIPQVAAQYYYYGSLLRNFYVTESSNQWSIKLIHLYEYLFSYQKGMFVWSPIYLLGVYGLVKLKKYMILATFLLIWCLGAFWSEHSAMTAGFGQRLSLASVPYIAGGIAFFYENLSLKKQLLLSVFFALWNIALLYGFYALKWKNLS